MITVNFKRRAGCSSKTDEQNPTLKIEIGGHTDNTGSEEKNKTLFRKSGKKRL